MNRQDRQKTMASWAVENFGAREAFSIHQRSLRLVEEAIECAQAGKVPIEQLHKLVDYIYARPIGEISKELAGISIASLILAEVVNVDLDEVEKNEVIRLTSLPKDYWQRRNEIKNKAGFNAE